MPQRCAYGPVAAWFSLAWLVPKSFFLRQQLARMSWVNLLTKSAGDLLRDLVPGSNPSPPDAPAPPPKLSRMIEIQYENWQEEQKVFKGDANTLRKVNNHLSLCVHPIGRRIALNRDRIGNLSEVEGYLD